MQENNIQELYEDLFKLIEKRQPRMSCSEKIYYYAQHLYYLSGLMGFFNPIKSGIYAATIEHYKAFKAGQSPSCCLSADATDCSECSPE